MSDLTKLSAAGLVELIRLREVSPVEVVKAHLRRIDEFNPRLNAVVTLAPDALTQASRAEALLMRGENIGALHGLPLTVKDTIAARDLRTTSGTRLRADFVPDADAPAVARLRAAGAIILGKTNTSELALDYSADNPLFGRTNNPHSTAHTPGGSSGGCASAVAACLVPASLGSDLSGSVRIPAHFCGVAGLRPTAGRVPSAGHFLPTVGAFSLGASTGPLARRVGDLELLFDVLAAENNSTAREATDTRETAKIDLRGRRVAFYTDDGVAPVTVETRHAVNTAARSLQDAGLILTEERPPGVEHGARLWLELFSPATKEFLTSIFAGRETEGGALVQAILKRARSSEPVALEKYFRSWAERDTLRASLVEWMEKTPLLVAPVGSFAAFEHGARQVKVGSEELPIFRAFSYAQAFNVFDLPAVSVPAGQTGEGLPVGVQIVGRPRAEKEVLAAARIVEEALGGWRMPIGF